MEAKRVEKNKLIKRATWLEARTRDQRGKLTITRFEGAHHTDNKWSISLWLCAGAVVSPVASDDSPEIMKARGGWILRKANTVRDDSEQELPAAVFHLVPSPALSRRRPWPALWQVSMSKSKCSALFAAAPTKPLTSGHSLVTISSQFHLHMNEFVAPKPEWKRKMESRKYWSNSLTVLGAANNSNQCSKNICPLLEENLDRMRALSLREGAAILPHREPPACAGKRTVVVAGQC